MSRKPLRPAATGDQHRGYYGNKPIKAEEGNGGIVSTDKKMKLAVDTPCRECPLRRDSAPGYLGGYTPEMYMEVMHSPASIACHSSPGFHEGDIERQRHCTGVAGYRANVGHVCQIKTEDGLVMTTTAHDSTKAIGARDDSEERYFSSPAEFYEHHIRGQE